MPEDASFSDGKNLPSDGSQHSVDEPSSVGSSDEQISEVSEAKPPREPTLEEDIAALEKLNLMRSVMIKIQGGRHPHVPTDQLLDRRLKIDPAKYQAPYVVRLVCTLMMVFVFGSLFWFLMWLVLTPLNLTHAVRLISTGFATVVAAVAGVSIFHPSSVPDEKILRRDIQQQIVDLRVALKKENELLKAEKRRIQAEKGKEDDIMDNKSENVTKMDHITASNQEQ